MDRVEYKGAKVAVVACGKVRVGLAVTAYEGGAENAVDIGGQDETQKRHSNELFLDHSKERAGPDVGRVEQSTQRRPPCLDLPGIASPVVVGVGQPLVEEIVHDLELGTRQGGGDLELLFDKAFGGQTLSWLLERCLPAYIAEELCQGREHCGRVDRLGKPSERGGKGGLGLCARHRRDDLGDVVKPIHVC